MSITAFDSFLVQMRYLVSHVWALSLKQVQKDWKTQIDERNRPVDEVWLYIQKDENSRI